MTHRKPLTASLEDYLEAIHHLVSRKGVARSKDIAQLVGVSRSSVTGALRALSARKLIHYAPYDFVTLTEEGRQLAAAVVLRHALLRRFLGDLLGLKEGEADAAACALEHALPERALTQLGRLVDFLCACPRCEVAQPGSFGCPADPQGVPPSCSACFKEGIRGAKRRFSGRAAPLSEIQSGVFVKVRSLPRSGKVRKSFASAGAETGSVLRVVACSGDRFHLSVAGRVFVVSRASARKVLVDPLGSVP